MSTGKQLWLLAGGNGAGKSTFYRQVLAPSGIKWVNADLIAATINPEDPSAVSYEAAALIDAVREKLLFQGVSFCFETVFSHPSKIDFMARAKGLGYEVILIYIHLDSAALNAARVAQRVSTGGHPVPEEKIARRIPRTMRLVATALPLADHARLLDNSHRNNPFRQVAVIRKGRCTRWADPLPDWAQQMLTGIPRVSA